MSHHSDLSHTLPEDKAPSWWTVSTKYDRIVWPPEAVPTDRLRRMMKMAVKAGDAALLERCAKILEDRSCGIRAQVLARSLGPDMLTMLSGLLGLCKTDADLKAKLAGYGWLKQVEQVVNKCHQPYYAARAAKTRADAIDDVEEEKAAIDATRPKGLANANQEE